MGSLKGKKRFIKAEDLIHSTMSLLKDPEDKKEWLVRQIISIANSHVHIDQKKERILLLASFLPQDT